MSGTEMPGKVSTVSSEAASSASRKGLQRQLYSLGSVGSNAE